MKVSCPVSVHNKMLTGRFAFRQKYITYYLAPFIVKTTGIVFSRHQRSNSTEQ